MAPRKCRPTAPVPEPTTPLPDGKYTLTAKETDGVGNVSGPSGEYIINVATVPPQAPTLDTVYDDVAPHADYLQKGDVTNDTTPTLSGSSGVAGGTISIYDNGRLIGTTSVAATAAGASRRIRRWQTAAITSPPPSPTAWAAPVNQPAASVSLSIQKPRTRPLTCWSPTTSVRTRPGRERRHHR